MKKIKASVIMEKLWLENREFVSDKKLKEMFKRIGKDYNSSIRYLLSRKYLIRVFRGIFYIKSPEEIKLGKIRNNFFDILIRGMELKGIKNWYFGLETALKLNNLTHEYFNVYVVINDKIFRQKSINIMGNGVKFIKIKKELFFGVKKEKNIKFSDEEKTFLDFVYLSKYNGLEERLIYNKALSMLENISEKKLKNYAKKYPKSVRDFLKKWKILKNL